MIILPKHTIKISKKINDKIKMLKIKHDELKNISDVVEFVVGRSDPDDDGNSWQETYRQNGVDPI